MTQKRLSVSILLLVLVASVQSRADNLYATIRGTVADPTGAIIAGVTITATNSATGLTYSTSSNKDGVFVFPQVLIGDYKVRIQQAGFKTYEAAGIHVDLNQVYSLDVKLAVGAVSEQLLVEANPVQVETTSMQQGTVVTGSQIVNMPLNGRNWVQLQQLEPGVVSESDRFGGGGLGAYSTNGSETQQNSYLINGGDSVDPTLNDNLLSPSPDAIGEFNMVTSTINPEFGRNSGAIINATIKNGTNQFHGDAFEFYRDTFLDAKSFFETGVTPFHRNQYGGTIGGPIVKDHAFFFFSYQGEHEREPQSGYGAVPVFSADQRTGNWSVDAGNFSNNPIPYPMYGDANSPCPVNSGIMCQPSAPTSTYANLFSTGVIPSQDLNTLALKLMNQFVPMPTPGAPDSEYEFPAITTLTNNQYLYRIDDKLRQDDSIWFYGFYQTNPFQSTLPFTGATVPGFAAYNTEHFQQYTTSWTHTFSPTALNEARFSYLRFNYGANLPVSLVNAQNYGFNGITPQVSTYNQLPVMTVDTLFTLGFAASGPQPRVQNTYEVFDNFSKVWGHHTFKTGFTMERLEINNPFYSDLNGAFTYNAQGPYSSGLQGVDFLLGVPDSYAQGTGTYLRGRSREYYSYAQDQWQIRPSLALTFGTGWDIEAPWKDLSYNGELNAAWRPGQQSTVFPFMPPGFVYPGDAGINQYGGVNIPYKDIAPRAGFAWSPGSSHNWSVRGGIGLYYNRSEEELILDAINDPPVTLASTGGTPFGSPVFATPFVGYVRGTPGTTAANTNPFPYTPPVRGGTINPSVLAAMEPFGFDFIGFQPNFTSPRSTNFNLTVQRQVSKSTILSVGYVASIGRHEVGAYNVNQAGQYPGVNPTGVATGAFCFTGLVLATSLCPQTPISQNPTTLAWTNGTPVPGATPYNALVYGQPGIIASAYNSNYNSLQVELNRRFSNGLQLLASYTWSRYFDETSNLENSAYNAPGVDPWNPRSMYAPSASDAPQRLVVSYTYTLPFYKFAHKWRRLTDDWNLSGIYTLQHGFPVAVYDAFEHSITCDQEGVSFYSCPDRPNTTGVKLQTTNPRILQAGGSSGANSGFGSGGYYWFTNGAASFSNDCPPGVTPSAANCETIIPGYTGLGIGTAARNPLYGPGINYSDLALEKNIHIDESKYVQLRLETFNTFNHTNFANPAPPGTGGLGSEDASWADGSIFGQINAVRNISTNGDGRVLQLGAKFFF